MNYWILAFYWVDVVFLRFFFSFFYFFVCARPVRITMMLQTLWKIISVSMFHRYCHHCRCRSRRHSYHVIFIYFNFSAVLWVFWSIFVRRTYSSCIKVSITLNWRMAPSIMLLVCVAYIRVESSVMATAPENFSTLATRNIEFLRQL